MSYLANVVEVGGTGGNAFDFNDTKNGNMLKKISVWVCETTVKAMKVGLTDGQSKQFGFPAGNLQEFTFEDGEHFISLSLWPNQNNTRLGAMKFKTSHSREFYASLTNGRLQPEVSVDVASGICMGIKGHSGCDIDRLGFMFINNIKSAELSDVEYSNVSEFSPKVTVIDIKSTSYQNITPETQEYKIEASKKITQTSSWALNGKLEFTSLEVKAGIPLLVKVSSKYKLKIGDEGTYPSKFTEEEMKLFSFSFKVPAGKTVNATIEIGKATVDLQFNGLIKVTCYNGSMLEFKTSGTYKGVAYSDGNVVVN